MSNLSFSLSTRMVDVRDLCQQCRKEREGFMTVHEVEEQSRLYSLLAEGREVREHDRADYRRIARLVLWQNAQRWRR